jgi:oxygen-independent coproporphyrinogen-3 oxidase
MTTTNSLGLYIHIPFCARKCKYCDFLSFACDDNDVLSEYTNALIQEIKIRAEDWCFKEVNTIFIGGGTPSLLSAWDMGRLLDALRTHFNVAADAEITVEANPATLSDEKLERYLRKGINRLSMGVQSFDNNMLGFMGRIHNKNDAFYTFQRAKKAGFENINLDLMFGIPGQTMKMWKDTVRQCIFLRPTHISLYSLQVEEGTEFYKMMYEDEVIEPVPEIMDREMYHTALKMLKSAGYDHYEISNACLPGCRSEHNMKYWSYDEYLGLGLGASSFANKTRFSNTKVMFDYIEAIKAGVAPVDASSVEKYTGKEEMGVYVFTGLRKTEGISLEHFRRTFGVNFFDVYDPKIVNKYRGLLINAGDRLYLSERGIDVSNKIMMEFV